MLFIINATRNLKTDNKANAVSSAVKSSVDDERLASSDKQPSS